MEAQGSKSYDRSTDVVRRPELPLERERGHYIVRTIAVENLIDTIIADYFNISHQKSELFEGHLLRRLDFSGKISTLIAIMYGRGAEACGQPGALPERRDFTNGLQEMREFRNLCAHARLAKQRADDGELTIEFVTYTSNSGTPRRVSADAERFSQLEGRASEMILALEVFRSVLADRSR